MQHRVTSVDDHACIAPKPSSSQADARIILLQPAVGILYLALFEPVVVRNLKPDTEPVRPAARPQDAAYHLRGGNWVAH